MRFGPPVLLSKAPGIDGKDIRTKKKNAEKIGLAVERIDGRLYVRLPLAEPPEDILDVREEYIGAIKELKTMLKAMAVKIKKQDEKIAEIEKENQQLKALHEEHEAELGRLRRDMDVRVNYARHTAATRWAATIQQKVTDAIVEKHFPATDEK